MTEQAPRDQILAANETAARYYRDQLLGPGAEGPRGYLTARGFAAYLHDTPWTIGYAPPGWTHAHDHLVRHGFDDDVLEQAGLVCRTRRGTTIDKYRDRITFGIRGTDRYLIGFTSRSAPAASDRTPKYLNCRHTALFDKSTALFGLGEQAQHLTDGATLVLVEGPFDALAVDLINHEYDDQLAPLALCGTAFTNQHTELLSPLVSGPVVAAFDGDDAGLKASRACYQALAPSVPSLSASQLKADTDPAGLLQETGTEGLRHRLYDLTPLADRLVDGLLRDWPHLTDSAEARIACLRATARLSSTFTRADRTRLIRDLPARLDLDPDTVDREIRAAARRGPRAIAPGNRGRTRASCPRAEPA